LRLNHDWGKGELLICHRDTGKADPVIIDPAVPGAGQPPRAVPVFFHSILANIFDKNSFFSKYQISLTNFNHQREVTQLTDALPHLLLAIEGIID
jgi:hypothetical protein